MKKLILLIFLFCSIGVSASTLEIKIVHQKKTPQGKLYGAPGGIYFYLRDLEPFRVYKLQYSEDFKVWKDMVFLKNKSGAIHKPLASPLWHWDELPPTNCFFRIALAW